MNKHKFSIEENEIYYDRKEQLIINSLVNGIDYYDAVEHFGLNESDVDLIISNILKKSGETSVLSFVVTFYKRLIAERGLNA